MTPEAKQNLQMQAAQKLERLIASDPQIASLVPLPQVGEYLRSTHDDLAAMIDRVFTEYGDRPALGTRAYDLETAPDGETKRRFRSEFATITYAQLRDRIHALADAWSTHPVHQVNTDDHICIFGFVGVDFSIIDFATAHVHATSVPLQMGAIRMDFGEILDSIKPATVAACTSDLVEVAKLVADRGFVRSLIVFDYDEQVSLDKARFEQACRILESGSGKAAIISLNALEAQGRASSWKRKDAHPRGGARVASIVHSSGSTGKPKAAMVPEDAIRFYWTSIPEAAPPVVGVCLAPFSHLLGKGSMVSALRQGGTVSFTLAPDMSTLFEDIRIAQPTFLGLFPRIVELVLNHYQSALGQTSREAGDVDAATKADIAKRIASEHLGDRLCFVLSGGSRIPAAVQEFFAHDLGLALLDAYGNTEGGSVAVDGAIQRPPVLDYRLRDVPELGYFSTDKPHPRGEMCFKSAQSILGYLNAPEATAALFDEDGYICTGDIVEELAPDRVRVIGRRNDSLKLSQGEFVSVGALAETLEAHSDLIHQAYVHGSSERSYLLAVVVPDAAVADRSDEKALTRLMQAEVLRVAAEQGLRSFEIPRAVIVETEPFSNENGLLSGLRKKIRPALANRYGQRLETLYEELETARLENRRALIDAGSDQSIAERLAALLQMDLNIEDLDARSTANFQQLGGDSLGAVLLSMSIEDIFGVDFPADQLLSPTGNLGTWARYIEQALGGTEQRPTAASIHGKGATRIHSRDLGLNSFIDADVLAAASALPAAAEHAGNVLITGANGFLGRFICLESLIQAESIGGKVICLVRASDNAEARKRLDETFAGPDARLQDRYSELAAQHLEVLAGDIGASNLGLRDEDYLRLSAEVDRVIHTAALVNHRLSYADLFGANVLGTAEILRFAITSRRKLIDYVSTIAVLPLLDNAGRQGEAAPLRDEIELSDSYAAGYAASKWASEHLLEQANDLGVPVNIFRGNMMLPHRAYRGQINTADMFSRLLFSLIKTGIAPRSFYPTAGDDEYAKPHYDGLPVDVVAATIARAPHGAGGACKYNISNYHSDDGCSLDRFVDWIENCGHPISRIDAHQDWFAAFRAALSRLPQLEKTHSALEIVEAFAQPQSNHALTIGTSQFARLYREIADGADIPHLDQEYIAKCLNDLEALGLIEPVSEMQARTR